MSRPIVEWNQTKAVVLEQEAPVVQTTLDRILRIVFGLGLLGLIATMLRIAS